MFERQLFRALFALGGAGVRPISAASRALNRLTPRPSWPRAVLLILAVGLVSPTRGEAQPVFPAAANVPGPSAALAASPPYRCVTNRYVDAVRGSDANPGTEALPWKTIGNAANGYPNTTVPGECVNVLPGVYPISNSLVLGGGNVAGNANHAAGYVVYRSTVMGAAHILAMDGISKLGNADVITLYGGFIIIDGFEIDGNHQAASGHAINGCAGGGGAMAIAHHFIAMNNVIHDVGGAGFASCMADYIIWRNNTVFNTSVTNNWQASGIAIWMPRLSLVSHMPWDAVSYRIQILYNVVHDNIEGPGIVPNQGCTPAPPAREGPPCLHTDGNGIIVDTTYGSAKCKTCGVAYPGNILVLGNVSYNNGGAGIHVFLSKNVTVANNTVYNNNLDTLNPGTPRGELSNLGSASVEWINNIAVAVPGSGVLAGNRPLVSISIGGAFRDQSTWIRNILYGSGYPAWLQIYGWQGDNLIGVDPALVDPLHGVFMLKPGSPAIGAGEPVPYLQIGKPNIGAY
jgi:parallel beta-helix repeat protein